MWVFGTARTYTRVPIEREGDGRGAEATVVVNNNAKIESVTVSNGGSNSITFWYT